MNIFKVLASRKKVPEDQTSVLLGWLFHPEMEHGLGRAFLDRFVAEAVEDYDTDVIEQLRATPDDGLRCSLEENVPKAFVDIAYFFGDYVFAIENKLYEGSIKKKQLQREYRGLCRKYPDKKIVLTYLVPDISPAASSEYNSLVSIVEAPHMCALTTWSDTICDIIDDVASGEIPVPEHTKYILESLKTFVKDDFCGYENFNYRNDGHGTRSNYPRATFEELKTKKQGFVGVAHGAPGLMKMSKEEILSKDFQYDDSLECNRQYWLPLSNFKSLAEQRIRGERLPIGIKQRIDSASIYEMVCQPSDKQFYVGIRGGERGMRALERHEIAAKSWQVTIEKQPSNQWITGERYRQIYEEKMGFSQM